MPLSYQDDINLSVVYCILNWQVNSNHPLAKAIVEYAKKLRGSEENLAWPEASDFESITGHGVKAIICNKEVILGNKSLMTEGGIVIPVEAEEALAETEGQAQTGILVSIDKELIGVLSISDPLKPEAPEVISILKSMNVESMIVTGDNWGTATAIAKQVGIERKNVFAEAKPEQKAEKVKELQVGPYSITQLPSFKHPSSVRLRAQTHTYKNCQYNLLANQTTP